MSWEHNRKLTALEAEATGLRFCYKCAKRQPVVGGRMIMLSTGKQAFVCAYHPVKGTDVERSN